MAWTDSHVFQAWAYEIMLRQGSPVTGTGVLTSDTLKAALFGGNTPDRNVTTALSGYNAATSQWVAASFEKTAGATEWVAGGRTLANKTVTKTPNTVTFDNTVDLTGTETITIAGVEGVLVYDDTIAGGTVLDQGVCYLWLGGSQGVTGGTFSVNFAATGIFTVSV